MTDNESAPQEEALTEEQRIAILEKSVRLHRWLVFAICLLLVIALSVLATFGVISSTSPYAGVMTPQNFQALQNEVKNLKQQNQTQTKTMDQLQQRIYTLEHSPGGSQATQLMRDTLIGQDQSFTQFIKIMKSGMHDLANMVPGSRTWLEVYEDALDKVINKSDARVKKLKQQWPDNQGVPATTTSSPGSDAQSESHQGASD